jgi:hypothetical protein
MKYLTTAFNGSFMQETVYRRPGSPEVDSAWEALGIECMLQHHGLYPSNKHVDGDHHERG